MALTLFHQIAGLFLIMGLGYALVRSGALQAKDSRTLSVITVYIVQPCVILQAFQIEFTREVGQGVLLAAGCAAAYYLCMFAADGALHRRLGLSPEERASILYANTGNMLIPLISSMFGPESVVISSPLMAVQLCFIWTQGVAVMRGEKGLSLRRLLTNTNLIAIAAGLVLLAFHIRIPPILAAPMGSVAGIFGPVSMMMMGMIFAGTDLPKILRRRRLYGVTFLRMVAVPFAVLLALRLSGLSVLLPEQSRTLYIVFLSFTTPTAMMITQLAQFYGRDAARASAVNVLTTLSCLVTMPLMTALYTAVM